MSAKHQEQDHEPRFLLRAAVRIACVDQVHLFDRIQYNETKRPFFRYLQKPPHTPFHIHEPKRVGPGFAMAAEHIKVLRLLVSVHGIHERYHKNRPDSLHLTFKRRCPRDTW